MKRFWIGIGLLLALLAAGIWADSRMNRVYGPISRELTQAADHAREGDWAKARERSALAARQWEKAKPLSSSFVSQLPLEQADGLFAQLEVCENDPLYILLCARLAREVEDISEGVSICWWNLA